jgi:hypothetical protein
MHVGLPGTGIGGLFYLLCALLMPCHELVRTLRGQSSWARWRLVGRQFGLALGIGVGLWCTSWLLDQGAQLVAAGAAVALSSLSGLDANNAGGDPTALSQVLGASPTLLAAVTFALVLLSTELLGVLVRPRPAADG